jgi:isoquinoline 1-oxidoreductase subunit alpha
MIKLSLNGRDAQVDVAADTPLLWVLRDTLGLTGTKFGCGMALCGACTVHRDAFLCDTAQRSRHAPHHHHRGTVRGCRPSRAARLDRAAGAPVRLLPVRPDHVGGGTAAKTPAPSDARIDAAMSGNICRCGTYQRIRAAIHRAAASGGGEPKGTVS